MKVCIENERKLLQQMSSGCGTQQNDSKDEPTYVESLEMHIIDYPTPTKNHDPESLLLLPSNLKQATINTDCITNQTAPRASQSMENVSQNLKSLKLKDNSSVISQKSYDLQSPTSQCSKSDNRKISVSETITRNGYNIPRLMSDHSINSISNDHEEVFSQPNLRDELLSCDQKELFQFLNDDFETSHNYFSDTVGYGTTFIDPDTESLLFDSKRDTSLFSPTRKASITSNKSNLSYISNSIFETIEQTRGGSISESIDRKSINEQRKSAEAYARCDELEPLVQDSEFENIIASFEKELSSIKNSTCSLQRKLSSISRTSADDRVGGGDEDDDDDIDVANGAKIRKGSLEKSSSTNTYEEILPMRQNNNQSNRNSIKLKRRSLEKQMKIDDDFNVSNEIRKICDHIQAPFTNSRISNTMNNNNLNQSSYINDSASKINSLNNSPKTKRKSDFHSSLDRIKRTSLIERVDESLLEDDMQHQQLQLQQPSYQACSERLPRKYLNTDMNIESLSLKSTGSYEHLVCHGDNKETKKIRFQKNSEEDSCSSQRDKNDKTDCNADGDLAKGKICYNNDLL